MGSLVSWGSAESEGARVAMKTSTDDLQTKLDDETAALRAQRESASPAVGAASPAEAPATAPSYGEVALPKAAPPPAPGLPYAALRLPRDLRRVARDAA
jgi:hypothetical protein